MRLRLQMLMPVSARCNWNRRVSSMVAVSGDRFKNAANRCSYRYGSSACAHQACARSRPDHALAQRADGIRTHRQLWDEVDDTSILETGRCSRYRSSPVTTLPVAARLGGLSRSDFVR